MPSKRQRIGRNRVIDLPIEIAALFRDEPCPEAGNKFTYAHTEPGKLEAMWREHGAEFVEEWAARSPGTRPACWWRWSAPRQAIGVYPGWYFDGRLPEPRQRLGGKGADASEVLAYSPAYLCGIPTTWVDDSAIRYYGAEFARGCERFDPTDPPIFESQAHYLRRFDLLLPGESRNLTQRDYRPVPLPSEHWPRSDDE